MKRYRVVIVTRARAQLDRAFAWWRANRPLNPALLRQEVAEATARLKNLPLAAPLHETALRPGVHRTLLPRTQYWFYYVVNEDQRIVTILALWHTAHENDPAL